MKAPNLEICIEGYNIEQTDFYISRLLEKNAELTKLCETKEQYIKGLTEENFELRKEYISFVKSVSDSLLKRFSSIDKALNSINVRISEIETALSIETSLIDFEADEESDFKNINNVVQTACNSVDEETQFKNEISILQKDLDELRALFKK